ncbi:MAG: RsmF rRNA methyltransferase first C-terminal domain-containing protein [Clostridiales bacterium]|nr:RsmF rRNA methyltransferase first C-terminal domain-containing protein [Clostridiales bacterium]
MTLPEQFCNRMRAMLGDEYEAFLRSYDTKPHSAVRINTLKCTDPAAAARVIGAHEQVLWCESGYYIDKEITDGTHPYHAAGVFYFQEPSAMCVSEGLPLGEDFRVLDLCAAPGGKTTHIAARMKNRGLLVSNEIIPKRAAILSENTERMGLTNTIVTNETPARLAEKFPSFFDAVIVDAPCSGEGMFKKEPRAITEWSEAHSLSCAQRQKSILDEAYKMLRPGGYIMYSTCTFAYEENEGAVEYMVEKYGMEICKIPCLDMLPSGAGSLSGIENCRRIFPHLHSGEGHFAALLKKSGSFSESEKKRKKNSQRPDTVLEDAIGLWRGFEKKALNVKLEGEFVLFGDRLYLLPQKLDISRLKILRCGLLLGRAVRGRFEPAHALSHALEASAFLGRVDLDISAPETAKYMHGEEINHVGTSGWCAVTAGGFVLGWGKASGTTVKNHYPKALRTLKY